MNGYEILIDACDKNFMEYTILLADIRTSLVSFDNTDEHSINQNYEDEQFLKFQGYMFISMLDLSVIGKNLCLAKSDWEKAFFIKHGYLIIHETLLKFKPTKGLSYVQQIIFSKYFSLKLDYCNILEDIENFKINNEYKQIEDIRHYIAGHIDNNLKRYYDIIFGKDNEISPLSGEKAALTIFDFMHILDRMLKILSNRNNMKRDFKIKQ